MIKMKIDFLPVSEENIQRYIEVGIQSYTEHYLHLWKNQDPSPFINAYLTKSKVVSNLKDSNQLFFIIAFNGLDVGILNITLDDKKGYFLSERNVLLNKIYLLKNYSNIGIGTKTLLFTEELARKRNKEIVWLYAMKKGKPLSFYKKHNYKIIEDSCIALEQVLDEEKEMWLMAKRFDI